MTWCKKCVLSDARPGLTIFPDGVCSACHAFAERQHIDWAARAREWWDLVAELKKMDVPYHVMLPTSGGKDSHAQAIKVLESGLRPIGFRWKPALGTPLGEQNFENYRNLGIECIEFSINPAVEKKLMLKAVRDYGSQGQMHTSIFHSVARFACQLGTPLVLWGEDSGTEYLGKGSEFYGSRELTIDWFQKIGSTHGTTLEDWAGDDIPLASLAGYRCPTQAELAERKIYQTFLWQYFPFDPMRNVEVAKAHGFQGAEGLPFVGWYKDADLDDLSVVPHHAYGKALKFGLTREQDNLSLEIRHGRMSREEACGILREKGHRVNYDAVQAFCRFVGITREEFCALWQPYRNREVWQKTDGKWYVPGFIVEDFDWNLELGD